MWAEHYKTESFDIDRLHGVIAGERVGRQCGKTFATFTQMVGEAQLGGPGNTYLYVGETEAQVRSFMKEFVYVLELEGMVPVAVFRSQNKVQTPTHTFYFMAINEMIPCKIRGYRFARTFIDLTTETKWNWPEEISELRYSTDDYYEL
jgi:hypothetical protein